MRAIEKRIEQLERVRRADEEQITIYRWLLSPDGRRKFHSRWRTGEAKVYAKDLKPAELKRIYAEKGVPFPKRQTSK